MAEKERRIFERFGAVFPAEINHPGIKPVKQAESCNISGLGVGIVTDELLVPSLKLEVALRIPDGHLPFHCTARVVWSNQLAQGKWCSGLKFEDIDFMGIRRALQTMQDGF